jgi:hypothetical protein
MAKCDRVSQYGTEGSGESRGVTWQGESIWNGMNWIVGGRGKVSQAGKGWRVEM